jgi:outer membrane protein assembly factor BamA
MRIHTWFVPNQPLARSMKRAEERCAIKNNKRLKKGKTPTTCNSFWGWLAYTVGEPPVLLDSTKVEKSARIMETHLKKQGYFQVKVRPVYTPGLYKRWIRWDKNAYYVTYHIYPGTATKINNVQLTIEDEGMQPYSKEIYSQIQLNTGGNFNVNAIDASRDRITQYLNNKGYFDFTKDYILIKADSLNKKNKIDLTYNIKKSNLILNNETQSANHKQYTIDQIYIHTDYDPLSLNENKDDTTIYNGLKIHYHQKNFINPHLLSHNLAIESGQLYNREKIDLTYKRLGQLGLTKNIYLELEPKSKYLENGSYALDAHVHLNPLPRQSISVLPKVTNRSGYAGIFGNVVYRHRNVFGGAENLEAKILLGFEASQLLGSNLNEQSNIQENIQNNFQLNTFEIGPQISLSFPRLFPFSFGISKKSSEPKSTIQATYNYQVRPDYERYLTQISMYWGFVENPDKTSKISIEWAEFSVIKIDKSPSFESYISNFNDQFLANSYQNHFISASKLGLTINTQKSNFQKFYYYYNGLLLEGAGNALRGVFNLLSPESKDELGSYEIKDIRFAQYIKTDHDLRLYYSKDKRNSVVVRSFVGCAIPLKNLESIPFEKSYFVGGSNGIRAWQARTLGVGAFRDTINAISFNNIGDIKLEFNAEYRFKITKKFQPAFFIDAGNIWLFNRDSSRPNAEFKWDRFLGEIAIGAGAGMRLDFDFFIIRLDAGFPMRDPQKAIGERWSWQPKNQYNAFREKHFGITEDYKLKGILNFGIGFPF